MDVVALGELLIDFTCVGTDADGYPTMAAHPGGAPANFLAALTKFGAKTALLGKVGTDTFGRLLTGTLRTAGIETRGLVAADDVFTTLAFVTLDETGNREFAFSRKPGADTCITYEELDLSLIDETRVFHFGTLSLTDEPARSTTQQAVAYAKSKGKLITYDPNLRIPLWKDLDTAKEQIIWGLEQADVVKISDEEVDFLWGLSPEEGADYILKNFGVKLVFVTCGPNGCIFKNQNACGTAPSLEGIPVSDTTGAGDIFGGSALWKVLSLGKAPEDAERGGADGRGHDLCLHRVRACPPPAAAGSPACRPMPRCMERMARSMVHTIQERTSHRDGRRRRGRRELQSILGARRHGVPVAGGPQAYWSDRALNIFPCVARLTHGSYYLDGQLHQMAIHGIAPYRGLPPGGERRRRRDGTLELAADEETLAQSYPRRVPLSGCHYRPPAAGRWRWRSRWRTGTSGPCTSAWAATRASGCPWFGGGPPSADYRLRFCRAPASRSGWASPPRASWSGAGDGLSPWRNGRDLAAAARAVRPATPWCCGTWTGPSPWRPAGTAGASPSPSPGWTMWASGTSPRPTPPMCASSPGAPCPLPRTRSPCWKSRRT